MENKSSKIYGIQVLRAICCTGILIAHSCHYVEINFSSIEPGFLSYPGRVGMLNYVVIFFVLSGYLTARQIHLGGGYLCNALLQQILGIISTVLAVTCSCSSCKTYSLSYCGCQL